MATTAALANCKRWACLAMRQQHSGPRMFQIDSLPISSLPSVFELHIKLSITSLGRKLAPNLHLDEPTRAAMKYLPCLLLLAIWGCAKKKIEATPSDETVVRVAKKAPPKPEKKALTIDTAKLPAYRMVRIYGWRIQVMNTKEREKAMQARNTLYSKFAAHKNYMIFLSPFYKIRFGNFKEKKQAAKLQSELKVYFPDEGLYLVPDSVDYKKTKQEMIAELLKAQEKQKNKT
jgi:hypothetical protein